MWSRLIEGTGTGGLQHLPMASRQGSYQKSSRSGGAQSVVWPGQISGRTGHPRTLEHHDMNTLPSHAGEKDRSWNLIWRA